MKPLHIHLIAWLSLVTAGIGLVRPGVYASLIPRDLLPGVVSQDIITLYLGLAAVFLVLTAADLRAIRIDGVAEAPHSRRTVSR